MPLWYQRTKRLPNRCNFGVRQAKINFLKNKTAPEAVFFLRSYPSTPLSKPLSYIGSDLEVPVGQTWTTVKYKGSYNAQRPSSYRAWWIGRMMNQELSLVEKMVLFWHNHFVIETDTVGNTNFNHVYNVLFYDHSLGNFKTLTEEITGNVGMLTCLDGV